VAAHIVRAVFLVVICRILGPAHFTLDMLLLLPFIVETSLYLAAPSSIFLSRVIIGVNFVFNA